VIQRRLLAVGRPRRVDVYGRTRGEVAGKLRDMQRRRDEGRPLVASRSSWAISLTSGYRPRCRTRCGHRRRQATPLRRHVIPVLGQRQLAKLTPADVQSWLSRKLREGLSVRTVQYQHSILRRAIGQAERWGLVARNVAALVQVPRPEHVEVEPLSVDDARALLEVARGDRLHALWAVALAVGLRKGEALALRWRDVDLDAGTLRVAQTVQRVGGELVFSEP
jgi:integrase